MEKGSSKKSARKVVLMIRITNILICVLSQVFVHQERKTPTSIAGVHVEVKEGNARVLVEVVVIVVEQDILIVQMTSTDMDTRSITLASSANRSI